MLSRGKRVAVCKFLKFSFKMFFCESYRKKERNVERNAGSLDISINKYEKNDKIKFMVKYGIDIPIVSLPKKCYWRKSVKEISQNTICYRFSC